MKTETSSELLCSKGVAARLGSSVRTVERWRVDGTGPAFIKIGKLVRYREEDVQAWLDGRRVRSTSEYVVSRVP